MQTATNDRIQVGPNAQLVTARLILGVIAVLFLGHLGLFTFYASPSTLEETYWFSSPTDSLFAAILSGWSILVGPSLLAARLFSVLCALATFGVVAYIARRWSGDAPAGAALTLGLILFPVTAFAFASLTPLALIALLTAMALSGLTADAAPSETTRMIKTASICVLLTFLHPLGMGLATMIVVAGILNWGIALRTWTFIAVLVLGASVMALLFPLPVFEVFPRTDQSGLVSDIFVSDVLRPYAMIWVATLFAVLALAMSKPLRVILGESGVRRSWATVAAFIGLTAWVIFVQPLHQGRVLIDFSGVLIVGILAVLPMVMWIRLVMPQLKSIVVWILLPVIMYSCFWVVLGPIDLNGFPHDQLKSGGAFSATETPG